MYALSILGQALSGYENMFLWASLKTGLNRENRQGTSAARKTDEARLDALRGGLTTQTAYPVDFTSNKVFRDALMAATAISATMPVYAADIVEEQTQETVCIGGYDCWEEDGNYFSEVDGEVALIIDLTGISQLSECSVADNADVSLSSVANGEIVDLSNGEEYAGQIDITNGDCSTPIFYKSEGSGYSRFKFRTNYALNTTYSMTVKLDWSEEDGYRWNKWLREDPVEYTFNLVNQLYKTVIILYQEYLNMVCQIDFHKSGSSGEPKFNYWMSASN